MRFEIVIPDSASADLKARFAVLTRRLSAHPELVEGIDVGDDAQIQAMFTPERLAIIDAANADIEAGNGLSMEQVKESLAKTRAQWLAAIKR
jgi:hypothetical protein